MARKRVRKAKLIAYPRDWVYCFIAGMLTGVVTWMIVTSLLT